MRVRAATSTDIPTLSGLNAEVQNLHISLHPERFKATDPIALGTWFESELKSAEAVCLVAQDDTGVVGYVTARFIAKPAHTFCYSQRYAYVDQICVAQSAQRKGIARELLEAVKLRAHAAGLTRVALDVYSANTKAKDAFTALGFRTTREVMELDLN